MAEKVMRIPVARQGYFFIAIGLGMVLFWMLMGSLIGGILSGFVTLFFIYFFRDPDRIPPQAASALLAPADGKILLIEELSDAPFVKTQAVKLSIFMSLFDCHVNRIPYGGTVREIRYQPGKFLAANLKRASIQNEQNALVLEAQEGFKVAFVQIAGLIARRIVCWVRPGDSVRPGERFGLIQFGSRLDLYLPVGIRLRVKRGDRVKAGLTILGYLS